MLATKPWEFLGFERIWFVFNLSLVRCDCSQTTGIPVVLIEFLIALNTTLNHMSAIKPWEFLWFGEICL
jgi:hypothetical protein